MRVLNYVNGVLTVIREDDYFCDTYDKPSFVRSSFYYEPTLKQSDGVALTPSDIAKAEAFIDSFVFAKNVIVDEPIVEVHAISHFGLYVGKLDKKSIDNVFFFEVPSEAPSTEHYWNKDSASWCVGAIIDGAGTYIGSCGVTQLLSDDRSIINADLYDKTLCFASQTYNFEHSAIVVDIEVVREAKLQSLKRGFDALFTQLTGVTGFGETASWKLQEDEARAWVADTSASTPLLDALLTARAMGETKEELIQKILTKADTYKVLYGTMLGQYHAKQKIIETATSVDALKACSVEVVL